MKTRETPIITFSNTTESILEYLIKRTSDTIGKQVDRSDVIIIGHVEKDEAQSIPVRSEHTASLKPWLSQDNQSGFSIFVQTTTVKVDAGVAGLSDVSKIDVIYVYPITGGPSATEFIPIFHAEDRGLIFLKRIPRDIPYANYIPDPAYQLAANEVGVRNFLVTDYDQSSEPATRDETKKIQATIAAIKWYVSLPEEGSKSLPQALLQALDSPNPQVIHHAVRVLALRGEPHTVEAFKARLPNTDHDLLVRLMLGLWILGEHEAATTLLDGIFKAQGKHAWLSAWDIHPTLVEKGQPMETWYGPDPSEVKGE